MNILEYLISTRKKSFSVCMSFTTLKIQGIEYHSQWEYFEGTYYEARGQSILKAITLIQKQ